MEMHAPQDKLSEQGLEIVDAQEDDKPTASHKYADADQDEKGAVQLDHGDVEVKDLGWNKEAKSVPGPLVTGLSNDELWTLIRRFNKQMFHVKSVPSAPVSARRPSSWRRLP
jgi:hypothetical protein